MPTLRKSSPCWETEQLCGYIGLESTRIGMGIFIMVLVHRVMYCRTMRDGC